MLSFYSCAKVDPARSDSSPLYSLPTHSVLPLTELPCLSTLKLSLRIGRSKQQLPVLYLGLHLPSHFDTSRFSLKVRHPSLNQRPLRI